MRPDATAIATRRRESIGAGRTVGERFGAPSSDEYVVTGGYRNNFRHGAIVWHSSTRTTTVIYT